MPSGSESVKVMFLILCGAIIVFFLHYAGIHQSISIKMFCLICQLWLCAVSEVDFNSRKQELHKLICLFSSIPQHNLHDYGLKTETQETERLVVHF